MKRTGTICRCDLTSSEKRQLRFFMQTSLSECHCSKCGRIIPKFMLSSENEAVPRQVFFMQITK